MPSRSAVRAQSTLRLEPLESRDAPAGLVAVSVSAGVLTLGTVPGLDGDEVLTVARQSDGSYLLSPGAAVQLRLGGTDFATPQAVFGVTNGLAAKLGAGNDDLTFDGASFTRSVAIDLGAGNNSLTLQDLAVGGNLAVTAAGGNDTVTFGGIAVGVGGAFTARLGDGTNLVQTNLAEATFGSFRMDGGAGNDTLQATLNNLKFTIQTGGLTFNGGLGSNTATLGDGTDRVAVAGPVSITGGAGASTSETVTIGGDQFDAGSLRLAFGGGTSSVASTATEFHLVGGLTYVGGAGSDALTVAGTDTRIGGAVSVVVGDGAVNVLFKPTNFLDIGRGVTMRAGAVTGVGNLRIESLDDAVIGGPVAFTAGAGNSDLELFASNNLTVGGPVRMAQGTGTGIAQIVSNNALLILGAVTQTRTGGVGDLDVFGGGAGGATIAGPVTLSGGQSQTLQVSGVVGGGVTMTGAPGAETSMTISSNSLRPVQIHGPVRVNSRSAAGQVPSIFLTGVIAEGPVTVVGGAGAETLDIENCGFLGSLAADLGDGADQFKLEQQGLTGASSFAGPVLLRGGDGVDTFLISSNAIEDAVNFRSAVTVDGGAGIDNLTIGTQATFDPAHPLVQLNIP